MKYVRLTQRKRAMIDDEDFALVSQFKWRAIKASRGWNELWYAITTAGKPQRTIYMHRLVTGAGPGEEPDHRNGDGLDNRRENLRLGSHAENVKNTYRHRGDVPSGPAPKVLSLREIKRRNKERMLERLTELRCKAELTSASNA